MQTIGVLGGMTWHSSIEYYRAINTLANERLGGTHAARCLLFSVDMGVMDELMATGRWDEAGSLLATDAAAVERAGADVFILGCNSLHHVWDAVVAPLTIPTIHIGDATADALAGHSRVCSEKTPRENSSNTVRFSSMRSGSSGTSTAMPRCSIFERSHGNSIVNRVPRSSTFEWPVRASAVASPM